MSDFGDSKKKGQSVKGSDKGSRAERLGSIVQSSSKVNKQNIIHNADEESFLIVPRISTGLYGLDVATNGGWPVGRLSMVCGLEGSGKSNLYLQGLADAQKRCANCYQYGEFEDGILELPDMTSAKIVQVKTKVIKSCPCGKPRDLIPLWADAENCWNTSWARRLGVATEKVMVVKPTHSEQAYDLINEFVSFKDIDLIVIDSLAQLTPGDELMSSMGTIHQGLAARVNNKFFRKLIGGMCEAFNEGRPITFWLVNQYRQKIGVMFGPSETLPGGLGQKFAMSLEVETRKGKITIDDKDGEPICGEFHWKVSKSKVGVTGGKGSYQRCMVETDVFEIGDLMEHEFVVEKAVGLGFVDHPNNVMYEYNGSSFSLIVL